MTNAFRIGVIGLFLIVLSFGCERSGMRHPEEAPPPFPVLCEGDIAFRRGVGVVSQMVLMADEKGVYSHMGIVVRQGGKWKVIHAVPGEPDYKGDPDRVKMDDLSLFFAPERAESGALMRVSSASVMAGYAAGKAFEIYCRGTLFDHSYDADDTTQMYCTELVNYVYRCAGLKLVRGKGHKVPFPGKMVPVFFPSDIQDCKKLKLIYQY